MKREGRSLWIRVPWILAAAAISLAVAGEVVLRVRPELSPEKRAVGRLERLRPTRRTAVMRRIKVQESAGLSTYEDDPYVGALLPPSYTDTIRTPDFTYVRETDHAGFVNHDPWPGAVDIVVLGSSLVIGPGVGTDGQFSRLLEGRLPGRTVLNLGVPGAGSELESRVEARYAEPFRPTLVILAIWPASDIDNSAIFDRWLEEKPEGGFTDYRFHYGSIHPDTAPPHPILGLLNKSALWRAAYLSTKALLVRQAMREVVPFADGDTIFLSLGVQHRLARGLEGTGLSNIREIFFGPLEQLQRRIEGRGGRFLVVLLPSKEEIYGADAFPPVLRAIREVRHGLRARDIPTLDLYPTFREWGPGSSPYYPTDIHYDQLGNSLIADSIAAWIEEQKLFPDGRGE